MYHVARPMSGRQDYSNTRPNKHAGVLCKRNQPNREPGAAPRCGKKIAISEHTSSSMG